jgi:hypothetical protein
MEICINSEARQANWKRDETYLWEATWSSSFLDPLRFSEPSFTRKERQWSLSSAGTPWNLRIPTQTNFVRSHQERRDPAGAGLCSGRSGRGRGGAPLDEDVAVGVGEEHGQDHLLRPCLWWCRRRRREQKERGPVF